MTVRVYTNKWKTYRGGNAYAQARKYKSSTRVFAIVFSYRFFCYFFRRPLFSPFLFLNIIKLHAVCPTWRLEPRPLLPPIAPADRRGYVGQIPNAVGALRRVPKIEYVHRMKMTIIIIYYPRHRVVSVSTFRRMRRWRRKHYRWWRGKTHQNESAKILGKVFCVGRVHIMSRWK